MNQMFPTLRMRERWPFMGELIHENKIKKNCTMQDREDPNLWSLQILIGVSVKAEHSFGLSMYFMLLNK